MADRGDVDYPHSTRFQLGAGNRAQSGRHAVSNTELSSARESYEALPLHAAPRSPLGSRNNTMGPRGVGGLTYEQQPLRYPLPGDDYLNQHTVEIMLDDTLTDSQTGHHDDYADETASINSRAKLSPPPQFHEGTEPRVRDFSASATEQDRYAGRGGGADSVREKTGGRPDMGGRRRSAWSASGSPRSSSPYGMHYGNERGHERSPSGFNTPTLGHPQPPNHLAFAEGDFVAPPSNAFSRFVLGIFERSFLFRWFVYLVPLLILLWVPGIVGVTAAPTAAIYTVTLVWWSCWTSVTWVCWFGAALAAKLLPILLRNTIGIVLVGVKHYIGYIDSLQFYIGAAAWSFVMWITFDLFVKAHVVTTQTTIGLLDQFLRALFIILCLLLGEKLLVQVIARDYHKRSFEDRILEQKFRIRVLSALYLNSRDIGRIDTMDDGEYSVRPIQTKGLKGLTADPTLLVKKALHSAKKVGEGAASMLGTVASEFAGERLHNYIPNSPEMKVSTALGSANKTKQLARRIYFSFTPSDRNMLFLTDIAPYFRDHESAELAFAIFDKDSNGDVTLEEMELACLDVHKERKSILSSLTDIDSAVARLDSILLGVWYLIALLVIIVSLDAGFQTTLAGAGTLVLSFSWLFATTAQEILGSFIFVFIKHSNDCGDRIDIDGDSYTVKEIHLLSTVLQRTDGKIVQAPNNILNTKFIHNIRRSGPISESFSWDVAYATTFEKIEQLRDRMLAFLETERRDFLPKISIAIKDFAGQKQLTLTADIAYRSNWQNGALKAQRRNKWTCALKLAMQSLAIYGPADAGDPSPPPADPIRYIQLPYTTPAPVEPIPAPATKQDVLQSGQTFNLTDPAAVLDDGVDDDEDKKTR